MKFYSYAATFEPAERPGAFVVTFPDVPEAITEGDDMADALRNASDALGVVLLTYLELGRPLPVAGNEASAPAPRAIMRMVTPTPEQCAKIAVIEAFAEAGISRTELARRMGKDEKEARRVLDPAVATKIGMVELALEAMNRRLVIGVEAAE